MIAATGSLAGTIVDNKPDVNYYLTATARGDGRTFSAFTEDGDFAIDQLPPGDYLASLDQDLIVPAVAFQIIAGHTTTISFTRPSTLITVDVTMNDKCTGVVFAAPETVDVVGGSSAHWIALAPCTDEHHSKLGNVAPGRYQICNSSCTMIDVGSSPDQQSFTIIATSDEPAAEPPETTETTEATEATETTETPANPSPTPDPAAPDPEAAADEGASTAE